jgi:hypothetical protein
VEKTRLGGLVKNRSMISVLGSLLNAQYQRQEEALN